MTTTDDPYDDTGEIQRKKDLRGVPPCPKCNKKDRLYTHMEGSKKIAVCWRCFVSGEIRRA